MVDLSPSEKDMNIAPLDRRVAVKSGSEIVVLPLSQLRDNPFVVLLGEPGAGKSTALEHEALAEGGNLITCRDAAINGIPQSTSNTAYLDALDEYRSDGSGKDKLLQLAKTISDSSISRWRITCRAEDWREAADVKAMKRAANNEDIVVAHLLPLNEDEAQSVLEALGEENPKKFVDEANNRGASAFLENPLSLKLLHSVVVSNGVWPKTRFELFDNAILTLAYEYDDERTKDSRPSPDEIVETASAICFYFLASGARALWHSNSRPPGSTNSEYVNIHALGFKKELVEATLDTALFRGEGYTFHPVHRTVAEFLAAKFLASKVAGGTVGTPAFPLSRAIALTTGNDYKAPTELRGFYAWFAAHLQKMRDPEGARQLILRDAATVLAYGDAAAFDMAGRRSILNNLDQDDPYFLTSQDGSTVLGGLAGDDLVADFITILDADVHSHIQVTVLQALADGPPVNGIFEKLREIVLSNTRPIWMRKKSAEVLIKQADDPISTGRSLLKDLRNEPLDESQLAVRASILTDMKSNTYEELRLLISDFNSLPHSPEYDDKTETLSPLSIALKKSPQPDFFDALIPGEGRHHWKVKSLLNYALEAAIDANLNISADRLWLWLHNTYNEPWHIYESDNVVKAIQRWIDHDASNRELELFISLIQKISSKKDPLEIVSHYYHTTLRKPSAAVINSLLKLAKSEKTEQKRKRLMQIVAWAARSTTDWEKWQNPIIKQLEQEGGYEEFIKKLLSEPDQKLKEIEERLGSKREEEKEKTRQKNIADLTPKIDAIASGASESFNELKWAASHYRDAIIKKKPSPLDNILKYTNEEITDAFAEGLVQYAINTNICIDLERLCEAKAEGRDYYEEYIVTSGIHQTLLQDREKDLAVSPMITALIGLRHSYFSREDAPSITDWAVGRLANNIDQGTHDILHYWNTALDAGATYLDFVDELTRSPELLSKCLVELLEVRPNLPEYALRQALSACTEVLTTSELTDLVFRTLERDDLEQKPREIWTFAGLALKTEDIAGQLNDRELEMALLAAEEGLTEAFNKLCPELDLLDRTRIEILGTKYPASDDWWKDNSISGIIRGAIRRLGASPSPDAGKYLKTLAQQVHASWQPQVTHAAAEHARKIRDKQFAAPSVDQIMEALQDGPPVSPSDLAAVVLEEVERYKATLRTGTEVPWKRFWNTDQYGNATTPQIENEDRDRLLELLRLRFEKYGIVASLPEARRGENTRADALILSHAGKNLPIEVKRHYNSELWIAPADQLAGYASDEGACGYGVYLVFWFGTEFKTPVRTDGEKAPESADELEMMLLEDLSPEMKDKISIVVLDVSRPQDMIDKVNSRKEP